MDRARQQQPGTDRRHQRCRQLDQERHLHAHAGWQQQLSRRQRVECRHAGGVQQRRARHRQPVGAGRCDVEQCHRPGPGQQRQPGRQPDHRQCG
nr:hypothetical protein [Xanthomonas citri]